MRSVRTAIDTRIHLNTQDLGPGNVAFFRAQFTRSNPDYHKKVRQGFWVGNIPSKLSSWRLDDNWLSLPRGAQSKINRLLAQRGLASDPIWDRTAAPGKRSFSLIRNLYPYQVKAVSLLSDGGVLRGPCGSGKTIIALVAAINISQPTLVIVHTSELMRQWESAIAEFVGIVPGKIQGNKVQIADITVGMQQTIFRRQNADWIKSFGTIIGDECHRWGADSFQKIADMFPARWRIGVSADERRRDQKEFLIYETFGEVVYEIKRNELVDSGRLVPVNLNMVTTQYDDEQYKEEREQGFPDWVSMIERMVWDDNRNDRIEDIIMPILKSGDVRMLMLTERVDACKMWADRLAGNGISSGTMIGGTENREELERTVDGLRSGTVNIGIGTSVADEGLDIPPLTHVVVTCPVHANMKRLTQMIGRVARKSNGKVEGNAIYMWDRLIWPVIDSDMSDSDIEKKRKKFLASFRNLCDSLQILDG